MKLPILLLLIVTCLRAEDKEPPVLYTLQIGDKKVRLGENKPAKVEGSFANPEVKLIPDNERHFTYGGLSFKYPKYFAFEADFTTEGLKIWTLDGNDFVIIVQSYEEKMTGADVVKEMVQMYGANTKKKEITYKFNKQNLKGTRLVVKFAQITLYQDVLEVPTKKGSRILILQDLPLEEKISDKESKNVLSLLSETFKF